MRAHNQKILVVDDNHLVLRSITATLEQVGYLVWATDSAEEAIELAAQVEPDVVVTDLRMPCMDGLALLERLEGEGPMVAQMVIYSATPFYPEHLPEHMPGVHWVSKTSDHGALLTALEALREGGNEAV